MSIYAIWTNNLLINFIDFNIAFLIGTKVMFIIFVMVQMRPSSDHKKLCGSSDLFNLCQWLAFEEMKHISTGC